MSKSEAFLKVINESNCLNCSQSISDLSKSLIFSPPNKFIHLICNPENSSIQFCRKILGWGQRDLANAFGVSVATVQDWENGRTPNSLQMKMCQRFLANMLDKKGIESTILKLTAMMALNSDERHKELVGG